MLRCKKLSETAVLPVRGSAFAAGYDLASAVDTVVPAKGKAIVKTDLAIAIPENTYARIAPRSGLAVKHFIDVGAGVVDYDYRGNVGVVLFNHSDVDFTVRQSDRIAQLILEKISMVPVEEVEELPSTERGEGGFGSTGTESHNVESGSDESSSKRIKLERGGGGFGSTGTQSHNVESGNDKSSSERIKLGFVNGGPMGELLVFVDTIAEVVGEKRLKKLKSQILNGGDRGEIKVRAIMGEYTATNSTTDLNESIDLIRYL